MCSALVAGCRAKMVRVPFTAWMPPHLFQAWMPHDRIRMGLLLGVKKGWGTFYGFDTFVSHIISFQRVEAFLTELRELRDIKPASVYLQTGRGVTKISCTALIFDPELEDRHIRRYYLQRLGELLSRFLLLAYIDQFYFLDGAHADNLLGPRFEQCFELLLKIL